MRADLANRQLMGAVRAGAAAPRCSPARCSISRTRNASADMVELPFANAPAPAHPHRRAIAALVGEPSRPLQQSGISPDQGRDSLAPDTSRTRVQVEDEELKAAYPQHRSEYITAEKRSAQVGHCAGRSARQGAGRGFGGEARTGLGCRQMAGADGGAAVELDDATRTGVSLPELGTAVFAAAPETISEPCTAHSDGTWCAC